METPEGSNPLETVALVTVALMSAVTAGTVVYRTFVPPEPPLPVRGAPAEALVHVPEWKDLLDQGILIGDPSAPVQIIEFADLECPFCRRFHAVLEEVMEERGDIAVTFVHFHAPGLKPSPFRRTASAEGFP